MHGPECLLNNNELTAVLRSGRVLSKYQSGAISSVVNMVNHDPKMSASSIRHALKPHLPHGLELTPCDVVNFRTWCKKHGPSMTENVTLNPHDIGRTIKEWSKDKGPPPMEEAGETLREVLSK